MQACSGMPENISLPGEQPVQPPIEAFALPHRIEGDRIDGKTIKLSLNRNELWTAALKLMLTDLKILTGWCSGS